MRYILALFLCLLAIPAIAQQGPPGTEVWLVNIEWQAFGAKFGQPRNLSNRPGYDNQPAFSPDGGHLWYTRINDDGVADIWQIDLSTGRARAFTATQTSEYSPTPTPDGQAISVIRVIDGKQWLYRLPFDGSEGTNLLPDVEPVGYHAWLSESRIALFVLGEPHTLEVASVGQPAREIAGNIGRGLKRAPDGRISFIDANADPARIALADPQTGEIEPLIDVRGESQDFIWTHHGWVLMGQDSRLFGLPPGAEEWQQLTDFSSDAIQGITRLALSPDGRQLALVANEPSSQ